VYQLNGKSSLKAALLLGAAGAAVTAFSASAYADAVETVVVTGSRIPQTGLYSASPVTTVSTEEIKQEGKTEVVDILNQLPQVTLDQSGSSNNGQSGTANVDLRALGAKRTLVLVNGTRLAPGDPIDPAADIDEVPAAMIDHVEVLTGGASAVYGSDALAGVVNFIMRKDFEGVEVDGQLGGDEADNTNSGDRAAIAAGGAGFFYAPHPVFDGGVADVSVVVGANTPDDKGNVTGYLTYHRQSPISWQARDFSACTMTNDTYNGVTYYPPQISCAGSSNKNRWISIDNSSARIANFTGSGHAATNSNFFETGTGAPGSGHFVAFSSLPSPQTHFNYGALNVLQRPDTRYTGGFFAHYEISKYAEAYASLMFMDDHTVSIAAPTAAFLGAGPIPTLKNGAFFATNCTNPLMNAQENQFLCGEIQSTTLDKDSVAHPDPGDGGTVPDTLFSDFGAAGPYGNGYDTLVTTLNCGTVPDPNACAERAALGHDYWNGQANQHAGQSLLEIGRRFIETGNRFTQQRHTDFRGQIGVKGDLAYGWTYDVYGQISSTRFSQVITGDASKTAIQNALEVSPIDTHGNPVSTLTPSGALVPGQCIGLQQFPPSATGCIPLDLFNGLGSMTPDMADYVTTIGILTGDTREIVTSAVFTGDLAPWGGKSPWAKDPIGASFGAEYRDEQLELFADKEYSTNDLAGAGGATRSTPLSGFHVAEGFLELRVPIVQDAPFFKDLTAELGYRYSVYSPAGTTNTWKADLDWQVTDDIKIRGGLNRAVRAPNVLELFAPQNNVLFSGKDPCAASSAGQCASVPNSGTGAGGLLACPAGQCNNLVGGNPLLKPETAMTETVGFVLTPSFIQNFSLTADYYNIKITNAITGIPAQETLTGCYGASATAATVSFFCPFVHRNAIGQIYGNGFVSAVDINSGFLEVRGVDVGANWATDLDDWGLNGDGSLSFAFLGTYSINQIIESVPVVGGYDCNGLYGPTCGVPTPVWRHKFRITWSSPWDIDFGFAWRALSATHIDLNSPNPLLTGSAPDVGHDNHIPFFNWFDLSADWHVSPNFDMRAGVNNVLGKDPPTLSTVATPLPFGNANTYPGTYDYLGRQFFVAATLKY